MGTSCRRSFNITAIGGKHVAWSQEHKTMFGRCPDMSGDIECMLEHVPGWLTVVEGPNYVSRQLDMLLCMQGACTITGM